MFSTLPRDEVRLPNVKFPTFILTALQHSKRKRMFAERYAMTNVMKAQPMAAIHDRAMSFINHCAKANKDSVDVYVCLPWNT